MAKRQEDREVSGSGRFGICGGGLSGDGDIQLFTGPGAARSAVVDAFREWLGPTGKMRKTGYITEAEADDALQGVSQQLNLWADDVDGSCMDVVLNVYGIKMRVGIFKADYVFLQSDNRNAWIFPHAVRLPGYIKRIID